MASELATLGGGCFWCLGGRLRAVEGASKRSSSGYAGGAAADPTYKQVVPAHRARRVVRITFDPPSSLPRGAGSLLRYPRPDHAQTARATNAGTAIPLRHLHPLAGADGHRRGAGPRNSTPPASGRARSSPRVVPAGRFYKPRTTTRVFPRQTDPAVLPSRRVAEGGKVPAEVRGQVGSMKGVIRRDPGDVRFKATTHHRRPARPLRRLRNVPRPRRRRALPSDGLGLARRRRGRLLVLPVGQSATAAASASASVEGEHLVLNALGMSRPEECSIRQDHARERDLSRHICAVTVRKST